MQESNIKEQTMSGRQPTIPDYSNLPRLKVPQEYQWRVTDVYPDSSTWQEDKQNLEQMIANVKPMSKDWTTTPARMFALLNHITEVEKLAYKLYTYCSLTADTDMADSRFQAIKGELQSILVEFESLISFIEPHVLKLGRPNVLKFMEEEPKLTVYSFMLESMFRMKSHILSADKERIIAQTGLFSGATGKAASLLNDVDIPAPRMTLSTGEKVRLNWAAYVRLRSGSHAGDRVKVMRKFWRHHAQFENTLAVLQDGAVKSHFFHSKAHHFKSCLEAALFPKMINPSVYHTLISTIKENLAPLHRYLNLKQKLLKLSQFSYEHLYASAVPEVDKLYTIEEAKDLVMSAMAPLGEAYGNALHTGLNSGWMDLYPNKNKRSGAYSNGSIYDVHPYVLMNYNGKYNSVSTLAHEYGHAMHSYLSNRHQPFPLAHYPIFLAEIASTFNETLLVHHLLKTESDLTLKFYIMDQYLEGIRGTLFRQTLFAEFELAMHQHVQNGQTLTPQWLNETYLDLTRTYYGHSEKICRVARYIKNEWSAIPHFYYNFYVYQYATGIAAATALAQMVLEGGDRERERYLTFLKSGGSKYPLEILKDAGVDLSTPDPIQRTLAVFDRTVTEMSGMAEKQNTAGVH